MKKSIVIIGPPRCGKSTLAQMLVKELKGYSMISGDNFTASYVNSCRDFDINRFEIHIPRKQSFYYLLECMQYENSIDYIIESSHYYEDIIEKYKDYFLIIFLGYPQLNEQTLFEYIRKNDNENDWTYTQSDFKLERYCRAFVAENKEKEEIAKTHNYWFVDTSHNRDKVLKDTIKKIKKILKKNE